MRRFLLVVLSLLSFFGAEAAERFQLRGRVVDAKSEEALPGVAVMVDRNYWSVTDENGRFVIDGIEAGQYRVEISSLGYVTLIREISLSKDTDLGKIGLSVSSLALDEVVVTAEQSKDNLNTTRKIGRSALDHLQASGLSDISALLPGGKTVNPDLTSQNEISLRSGGVASGNAAFSTAVEVNGVRMGDNADFRGLSGVPTRSLQVENIESVEVIAGVPSAEYGDLGSGMIRVITKKGRTPVHAVFSVNPRTYSASVSKGMDLGSGVLNISGEWTRATAKLSSPYTSYTRRGFTAEYSNTFRRILRFEAGLTGNIGGMDSRNDPDVFSDEYARENDNILAPHFKTVLLLNRDWITNISLEGSVYYHDRRTHEHIYNSFGSVQPAVHSQRQGYFAADLLPVTFYADRITDSRELDYNLSLKYDWLHHFGPVKSIFKAGIQWKADGNVGQGEYYQDTDLAASGYRPRPYSEYPYMHNLALFAEDKLDIPVGRTVLNLSAGLRLEQAFVAGSEYRNLRTLSPRLNAKWKISDAVALRGGWGIARKLPSFYILYPRQEYRDILTFAFSHGDQATYIYCTEPYKMTFNPDLQWQKNTNAEVGMELDIKGFQFSLVGFRNRTDNPYEIGRVYTPVTVRMLSLPEGFSLPQNPETVVDSQTGDVFIRGSGEEYFTPMTVLAEDRTFVGSTIQQGGAPIVRTGLELTADFPEIRALRTRLRLDASWTHTRTENRNRYAYYQNGWSHPTLAGHSFPYAGIYLGGTSIASGRKTGALDANLTAITHIPDARLVITCRLEGALVRTSRNTSERAFTVTAGSYEPTGGNIYDGDSYTAVYPVAYLDTEGVEHAWTDADSSDPGLSRLILRSGNMYLFAEDGYNPYFSANLSITKEIGDHVSLSFFANNFTNARKYVTSRATGIGAIFTPAFYYGLTCRIKF